MMAQRTVAWSLLDGFSKRQLDVGSSLCFHWAIDLCHAIYCTTHTSAGELIEKMQPDQKKRPLKAAKDKSFAWYDSITGVKNELLFSKCTEQKRIQKSIPGPAMLNRSKIKNLKPTANPRMTKARTKTMMKPTMVSDESEKSNKNLKFIILENITYHWEVHLVGYPVQGQILW